MAGEYETKWNATRTFCTVCLNISKFSSFSYSILFQCGLRFFWFAFWTNRKQARTHRNTTYCLIDTIHLCTLNSVTLSYTNAILLIRIEWEQRATENWKTTFCCLFLFWRFVTALYRHDKHFSNIGEYHPNTFKI